MNAKLQTIVIAWMEEGIALVRERRTDLGERPVMRAVSVGRAAVWRNRGTPADLAKAKAYAAREGYSVIVYPTTEQDPQARARKDIVSVLGKGVAAS